MERSPNILTSHMVSCAGVQYVSKKIDNAKKGVLPPEQKVQAIVNVLKNGTTQVICPLLYIDRDDVGPLSCSALYQQEPAIVEDDEACRSRLAPCPYVRTKTEIEDL